MITNHKHSYVGALLKHQKLDRQYTGNNTYKTAIVEYETLTLYCTECGDSKTIASDDRKEGA